MLRPLLRAIRRFRADEGGFVLVFLAVALPAMLGLTGLALDGGRFLALDAQLAATADAAALAAASALDGAEDAIPRARAAALALGNAASFAENGAARVPLGFRFARSLAELRSGPAVTLPDAAGAEASYVEVTTGARSIAGTFLGFVGLRPTPLQRRAVAVSRFYACDVTPAVLCHRDPDRFAATARPGRQLVLRYGGAAEEGAVVLLDPPGRPNGPATALNLASHRPAFCFSDGVTPRRNVAPAVFTAALNTRFDLYANGAGPIPPELAVFPPAPNVLKGKRLDSCASDPAGGSALPPFPLPRDSALKRIDPGTPWDAGGGDWAAAPPYGSSGSPAGTALEEYLVWNHANKPSDFTDRLRRARTRYEIYLRELGLSPETEEVPAPTRGVVPANATMPTGGPRAGSYATLGENPVPACYRGPVEPTDARRRVLYLAVADCGRLDEASALSLSRNVAKLFLTEPARDGTVLAEFVGMLRPFRPEGKLRQVVQLVAGD